MSAASVPEPRRSLLFTYCPGCEERFFNGSFWLLAYTMHYAEAHLGLRVFRDMTASPEIAAKESGR